MYKQLTDIKHNLNLNLEEQFQQLDKLQSLPLYVTVATGQRCNLRCVFCWERDSITTEPRDLNLDQFLRYASVIGKASRVQIYGWGEPFFNPDYERILDYVIERHSGTRIHISTNGVLLTDKWIDKLLDYGKCLINVSLNAATAKTYQLVSQRDLYYQVVDNLHRLMQARAQQGIEDFIVSLSFVTIKQNIHELPRFIELCAELGIQNAKILDLNILEERHQRFALNDENETRNIFLKAQRIALSNNICMDTLIYRPVEYYRQDPSAYTNCNLPIDLQPVWSQGDNILFYPQPGECYEPWQTFMVMQDGSVYTCCRGREIMGNLLEQSFQEIWNGEKFRAYRRSINSFRPPEACRTCPVKMGYAAH
jgi:radical SAM protein with 4Fe4S-binding SPASM domain